MCSGLPNMTMAAVKRTRIWLLAIALLSGCATMNKDQCLTANWEDVGYQNGYKGQNYTTIERYQKSCAKHGVTVDAAAYKHGYEHGITQYCEHYDHYQAGRKGHLMQSKCRAPQHLQAHQEGISDFCRLTNPYQHGVQGRKYHNVCNSQFATLYNEGKKLHNFKSKASALEKRIDKLQKKSLKTEDRVIRDQQLADIDEFEQELKIINAAILAEKIKHKDQFSEVELLLDVYEVAK